MTEFQLGSISTGTLRTEDLLPAFVSALEALGGAIDTGDWNDPEQATWDMEALTDALQTLCPPFVYFGTLEGDGSDFGFWPDMDSLGEAMQRMGMARGESDEERLEEDGIIVQVSDHGNVTVMDMERNVLWSVV